MPVYNRTNIPASVCRGTLDPELKEWLPKGPTLGADVSIAQGRRDHTILGAGQWPAIGAVETVVLRGPHGSLAVRRHTPTRPTLTRRRGHWSTSTVEASPMGRSTSSRSRCLLLPSALA